MNRLLLVLFAKVLAVLVMLTSMVQAQSLLPVPALTGQVIDQTNTLSAADKASLSKTLAAIAQQRGSQVVVLLVASTQGEPIEDLRIVWPIRGKLAAKAWAMVCC